MTRTVALFSFLLLSIFVQGQSKSNLIVFSADGEQFYLILNGIKQNAEPETNVKVLDLLEGYYRIKIVFKNQDINSYDKNMMVNPNAEITTMIEKDKKGNYKLKYRGEIPMDNATDVASDQVAVTYTTTAPENVDVQTTDAANNLADVSSSTTTTTTSTTTSSNNSTNVNDGENVSMGINVNGVGMNVNVQANDGSLNGDVNSDETTTTTTTQVTTTTYGAESDNQTQSNSQTANANSNVGGCAAPMVDNEFSSAKSQISSESFADDKMKVAKQMTRNNCLYVTQVKQVMALFDFSDDKLEYAKYAYDYTYDKKNYYQLNSAFEFSSDKDELNEFLNNK